MSEREDPDLQIVEAIFDALDAGEPARALQLVHAAIAAEDDDDPVIHFLAGVALLEMDQPEQAVDSLRKATGLDPEDAEFAARLALALYRSCRFDEGLAEARRALELDSSLPDAHCVAALLLERGTTVDEAESHFKRAARLDSERFPEPLRLSETEFRTQVEQASELLPERFARHLEQVVVTVENLPSDAILRDQDPPLDPELFGLFDGVPLTGQSAFSPGGDLPPRILLFQRNLERWFPEEQELMRQIAVTLYHELGHYLGLDEDELEAIDLG